MCTVLYWTVQVRAILRGRLTHPENHCVTGKRYVVTLCLECEGGFLKIA